MGACSKIICDICHKKLTNKFSLNRHVKTIHEKKEDFTIHMYEMPEKLQGDASYKTSPAKVRKMKKMWNAISFADRFCEAFLQKKTSSKRKNVI